MIVVTGAAGRLGRMVAQLLVDQNREVLATDQLAADDLPAEFVRCDPHGRRGCGGYSQGRGIRRSHGSHPRAA